MIDLYYWPTPNGHKITLLLEELAEAGAKLDYRIVPVNIGKGDQFKPEYLAFSPNNKMPAIVDHAPADGGAPISVFESGAILLYLAEKFQAFLPEGGAARAECLSWLFWQMGSAPYLGGGFGHFYAYAPMKNEYAIDRFAMETKRQLDVLDRRLAESAYLGGANYTIADIAVWPWYGALAKGQLYEAGEFLQVQAYTHVLRWAEDIAQRPAAQRGRMVNRVIGPLHTQLHERHDASDFDTRTQDKVSPAP